MVEPAVFIVVAILAVACGVTPFVYWAWRSRRHPREDPNDRIGPILRRVEAGRGSGIGEVKDGPGAGAAGIAGMVGSRTSAETRTFVTRPPERTGSGSSTMSGATAVGESSTVSAGPSSARPSTSVRPSHAPSISMSLSSTHTPSPPQPFTPSHSQRPRPAPAPDAPPAYEEAVGVPTVPEEQRT